MALFSVSGLVSGIDTAELVKAALDRRPIVRLQNRQEELRQKMEAWREVNRSLLTLQHRAADLRYQSLYQRVKAASSDESLLTASASSTAAAGTYRVEIVSLAAAHSVAGLQAAAITGNSEAGAGSPLALAGTLVINGRHIEIGEAFSLKDIAVLINETEQIGVSASVIDSRLVLTRTETGAAEIAIADSDLARALGLLVESEPGSGEYRVNTVRAGSDAAFKINDLEIRRSTNTISDVLEGVTLQLHGAAAGQSITLTVAPDHEPVIEAVKALVEQYNATRALINDHTYLDPETGRRGILQGDSSLNQVLFHIRRAMTGSIPGVAEDYRSLADVGVSTVPWGSAEPPGTLVVNEERLRAALAADAGAVARLFGALKPNAAYGSTVTASSQLDGYPAASIVNGNTSSELWGSGNGWVNSTGSFDDPETDAYADSGIWVKIAFNDDQGQPAKRLIDQVNVYTLDSPAYTAAEYGIRDYDVQYWDGSGWQNLVQVRGNVEGMRSHRFDPVNTEAIRIKVYAANDSATAGGDFARIIEVEALACSDGAATRLENYLRPVTRSTTGIIDSRRAGAERQIRDLDRQIEKSERRLEIQEAALLRQFVAMERALGTMMSQSQWLDSQLRNLISWNPADYRRR